MIGDILIRLALVLSILTGGLYYYRRKVEGDRYLLLARSMYQGSVLLILGFCSYLLYLIMTHQFQYTYVWNYSSIHLPTPLLISTFYAGQEGSFSLWTFYTGIVGIFLLGFAARRNYENEVMSVWCLIQVFLLVMLTIKSPFMLIWDSFPKDLISAGPMPAGILNAVWLDRAAGVWARFPAEGKGLNPLLQNYWMVIHPQILFSGFTAMAVPYAFALAGLVKRDYTNWVRISKPWIVYGAAMLGTGIILGGYWAYETLGWGGYWGWDPVENSSLIPWLFSVATIHTIMAQTRSGTYVRTNFILAMSSFVMVMYSTFLTRSGVLGETSVHSFVAPGMWAYWFLLGFIVLFTGLGAVSLISRWKDMPFVKAKHSIYSREFALFLGAFTICFAAIFITIGTSAPIITTIWKGKAAAVDIDYYIKTTLPLGIVIAILAGVGQLLWWTSSKSSGLLRGLLYPSISTIVFTIGIIIAGVRDIEMVIFSASSAFALFVNLHVGYRIFRGNPRFSGGALAHIGIALMFLGFVSSARYDEKKTVSLEKGKSVTVMNGYTLTYLGSRSIDEERFGFNVRLEHDNRFYSVMPTMHFSSFNNSTLRHPDILNMYTSDFYLTPLSVEQPRAGNRTSLSLLKGESGRAGALTVWFIGYDFGDEERKKMMEGGGFTIRAEIEVADSARSESLTLLMENNGGKVKFIPASPSFTDASFTITRIQPDENDPEKSKLDVAVEFPQRISEDRAETLIVEASIKPYINLVWLGTVTLVVGFVLTIIRRVKESATVS